jgi:hypothetical protein
VLVFWILQLEPKMSKVNAGDGKFYSSALFVQLGLQLRSDMTIRIYSSASIAENPMLCAVEKNESTLDH